MILNLKGITVDKTDNSGFRRNANIALIHVSNHVAMFVDNGKCASHIRGCVYEERPIGLWREFSDSAFGTIEKVNVFESRNIPHEYAGDLEGFRMKDTYGPGSKFQKALRSELDHAGKLLSLIVIEVLVINFGNQRRVPIDSEDGGLPAASQFAAKGDSFTVVVKVSEWCHQSYRESCGALCRVASSKVLSSSVFSFTRGEERNSMSDLESSAERPSGRVRIGANKPLKNGSWALSC